MDQPTGADIRDWAPPDFPWAKLGWSAPAAPAIDPLDKRVEWAVGYVEGTTWRPITTVVPPDQPGNLPMVESGAQINLVPIAEQAIMLATLQQIAQQSKGYFTATVLQDYLQSFTAGSYSETRSSAQTVLRSRGSVENPLVNEWRPLSDLLYVLMTPDAYDYWRFRLTGVNPPAGGFISQDWGGVAPGPRPAVWGPGIESWPVGGGW
jgi:hypothetical protein